MKAKKSVWERLVAGELKAVNYGDIPAPVVEILPAGEDSLPRLRFTWWKDEYCKVPADADPGFLTSIESVIQFNEPEGYQFVWAIAKEPEQRVLCNFRRYSWSWTADPEGHLWYCHGVDYCNCSDAGLACSTPEQIVRETLIAAMWSNPEGVPRNVLWGKAAQELLPVMLEDALANITFHAESPILYRAKNGGTGNYYL